MPVAPDDPGVIRAFPGGQAVARWNPVSFVGGPGGAGVREVLKDPSVGEPVACWSGSVEAEEGLFTPSIRTWGPAGQAAFEAAALVFQKIGAERSVWLRTHARHVLCDSVRCERVFAKHATERLKLLADPAGLFTRQMVGKAEDHLQRTMESFARQWSSTNQIAAVVLTGLVDPSGGVADPMQTDTGEPMRAVGLRQVTGGGGGDGGLVVRAFVESFGGLEKRVPVVLLDDEPREQVKMLIEAGWRVSEPPV
ncbi:MAG: hypothetical protein IBJ18_05005 [Phycisphaerales bacterium]|nr:hypothetical protein [Phycisphaerales bacterium]